MEEGEKKMAALQEELQERLELIKTDLSSVQNSEEALQKFVSFTRSTYPSFLFLISQKVAISELNDDPAASKEKTQEGK